ncbi:hypothetical protein [Methylomonas koyamae]|uniref:hypothetical protein n=1 Tax=Methylomonas koyamae TaxID=702114 RepID=UPI0018D32900|nr:hypothetical protein [Methylomonas koyamae]
MAVAETVQANQLRKGIVWHGLPACLTLRFLPMAAEIELSIDQTSASLDVDKLSGLAARMLGLNQPVELVMHRALLAVPEFERTSIFISITVLFRSAVGK